MDEISEEACLIHRIIELSNPIEIQNRPVFFLLELCTQPRRFYIMTVISLFRTKLWRKNKLSRRKRTRGDKRMDAVCISYKKTQSQKKIAIRKTQTVNSTFEMTSQKVPRVVLGCATMGPPGTNFARVTTIEGTKAMFKALQSHGYTELDTARMYNDGKQEAFTRETGVLNEGFTIATKVYPSEAGMHKPERLRHIFETSLRELGQQSVEIFYLHAPDRSVPFEETLEEINQLHQEGKFKIFGLSNYAAWEVAQIAQICISHQWIRPRIYQGMYNALTRALEEELVPCCRYYGIDILVYNPLAAGVLSGRYKSLEIPQEGRFSDVEGNTWAKVYRDRYLNQVYIEAINSLTPVVENHGLTLIETALRWLVHHSKLRPFDGDGIVIGASSIEQLDSNLKDLQKGPLPDEVVRALDEAWHSTRVVAKTYWR